MLKARVWAVRPARITAYVGVSLLLLSGCAGPAVEGGELVVYHVNPMPNKALPPFPQAEGFGAYAIGGRAGRTYFVTTTADYRGNEQPIPGSLRQAVEAEGPRTVLFATGGTIKLAKALRIQNPYLTIAGQTAPGGGICISRRGIEIATHDVIIRHVRIRPAAEDSSPDCISMRNARNVIIDHCSLSWSGDELCSATRQSSDITVQWCILAEPLDRRHHAEPVSISGSRISFHHNLIAHGNRANPVVSGPGPIDFRNNLIYNWRAQASSGDAAAYNFLANYLTPGPDTPRPGRPGAAVAHWVHDSAPAHSLYLAGNVMEGQPAASADNRMMVAPPRSDPSGAEPRRRVDRYLVAEPFPVEEVQTDTAEVARRRILESAGATEPRRDEVDRRIVADVEGGTGRIIKLASDVGGLPALAAGTPAPDRDGDGMPDAWERNNGLDVNNAADAATDSDGDGYPNLEEFINATDPRAAFDWVAPPVVSPDDGSIFLDSVSVSISYPAAGAEIRYTLDGGDPERGSALYSGPFQLRRGATVKARAFKGPLASRLGYATLRKVTPYPASKAAALQPGLVYEYSQPVAPTTQGAETQWKVVRTGVVDGFRVDWIDPNARLPIADFTGYLAVPHDGVYSFTLSAPSESELWIDGVRVLRNEALDGDELQAAVALAGGMHAIKVHYWTWRPGRPLKVFWQGPGIDRQEIPTSALFHAAKK